MKRHTETARRLREARLGRNLSQTDLANLTKRIPGHALTPAAISNYEQGTRCPNHESAYALEVVFGLPSAYFTGEISHKEALVIAAMRKKED